MIYLRELTKKDLLVINKWRNDKEIIDSLIAPFRFINQETDDNWFDNYQQNRNEQVRCSICLKENDELIGLVSLTSIDYINRSGLFHLMLGKRAEQGKGYGTAATKMMIGHAFNNLNLHRLFLIVLEDNEKAVHIYEKCGFKKEGLMKDSVYKNGAYKSTLMMSLLKAETQNV
jgi:UDP-4-amino-4,6-dideoxy-N-acetyl-beta-L-altrosamine N-acetyltransferase